MEWMACNLRLKRPPFSTRIWILSQDLNFVILKICASFLKSALSGIEYESKAELFAYHNQLILDCYYLFQTPKLEQNYV